MSIEQDAHHAMTQWAIGPEIDRMLPEYAYEAGYIQGRMEAPKEQVQVTRPLMVAQVHSLAAVLWDQDHGTKFDELPAEDQEAVAHALYQSMTQAGILAQEP